MKKLYKFTDFVNEKKDIQNTEKSDKPNEKVVKEIERDAKKIATEMFDKTRNLIFEYIDGLPSAMIFYITDKDYNLDYKEILSIDYSENVLKKRSYKVELKYQKKNEEKISEKVIKYSIKFKIKLTSVSDVKFDVGPDYYLVWEFEEEPKEIIKSIKQQKQASEWNGDTLMILKSSWDKLAVVDIKRMIKKAEGIKKRNVKV